MGGNELSQKGVPLLDLTRQYGVIGEEMEAALLDCARSGRYILGQAVTDFEQAGAKYCNSEFAVGMTSGSDALIAALMVLGIGPGHEVITTPFTFFATAGAIQRVGASPVFVDIEADGFNLDPEKIEGAITDRTKAIMPVHLFGQCAEMDAINRIASQHDLYVIEDAAQAIGSEYNGKRAGSLGDCGCFSFFPSKNLGCMGDGGMVTTNDADLADKLVMARNHGMRPKYYHKFVGGNFRLDAIQAAVLSVKLPHLDTWHEMRQNNADLYRKLFEKTGLDAVVCPIEIPGRRHIYNQFTLRIKKGMRNRLLKELHERNIGCDIYYPVCLHQQECFEHLGYKQGAFPVAEKAAGEVMSIPIYPELTPEEITFVVDAVFKVLG